MKLLSSITAMRKLDREAAAKSKVIAVMNHKGGCGKTSLVDAFAHILMKRGYRVLIIDNDPQCNISQRLGIMSDAELGDRKADSLYNALISDDYMDKIKKLPINVTYPEAVMNGGSLSIIVGSPNSEVYAATAKHIFGYTTVRGRLNEAVEYFKQYYDFVFIDTAPSIHDNAINELVVNVVDNVIIPFDSNEAVLGLNQFMKWLAKTQIDKKHDPVFVLSKYQADVVAIQRAETDQKVKYENENRCCVYRAMKEVFGKYICTNGIQELRTFRSLTYEGLPKAHKKRYIDVWNEIESKMNTSRGLTSLDFWHMNDIAEKLVQRMRPIERSRRNGVPIKISGIAFRDY